MQILRGKRTDWQSCSAVKTNRSLSSEDRLWQRDREGSRRTSGCEGGKGNWAASSEGRAAAARLEATLLPHGFSRGWIQAVSLRASYCSLLRDRASREASALHTGSGTEREEPVTREAPGLGEGAGNRREEARDLLSLLSSHALSIRAKGTRVGEPPHRDGATGDSRNSQTGLKTQLQTVRKHLSSLWQMFNYAPGFLSSWSSPPVNKCGHFSDGAFSFFF